MNATTSPVNQYFKALQLDETDHSLSQELLQNCGIEIERCLECGKCSGGCSNAHIFDFTPRKIVQMIKVGDEERLLHMDALWCCVACQLCVDRCPSGIDIARIMDYLRERAVARGIPATRPTVELFHNLMLDQVHKIGRVSELYLILNYNLKSGQYLNNAELGPQMFIKGKLNPFPARVKKMDKVRRLFHKKPGQKGEVK
ncbi:MAG TPA: heterodisulfide reductase subunit C [Syntrophomonas sp.]|jgi:heterodisulfide reductase subunit C|nr:heterodisulfide reductase subunit C [Syntrophomonas sp.]